MSTETKRTDPDVLFCVAREAVPGSGEDSWCYSYCNEKALIGVFDGSGGSGAQRYQSYGGRTGAYVASRAVSGAVQTWFEADAKNPIEDVIGRALQTCEQYSQAEKSRIRGSLRKNFPTTMAILKITAGNNSVHAECLWAGDSRCYACDADGLHQLSTDDVDNVDAMENLTDDCVLRNVINTSVPYFINTKTVSVKKPCIFLTATDGCFGYLLSPMHFEYLIVDTLCASNSIDEWKKALDQRLSECAGDDYSLCVAGYGYATFKAMKESFYSRREYLLRRYITSGEDPHMSWRSYKPQYESLMTTD